MGMDRRHGGRHEKSQHRGWLVRKVEA